MEDINVNMDNDRNAIRSIGLLTVFPRVKKKIVIDSPTPKRYANPIVVSSILQRPRKIIILPFDKCSVGDNTLRIN